MNSTYNNNNNNINNKKIFFEDLFVQNKLTTDYFLTTTPTSVSPDTTSVEFIFDTTFTENPINRNRNEQDFYEEDDIFVLETDNETSNNNNLYSRNKRQQNEVRSSITWSAGDVFNAAQNNYRTWLESV